jgi:hypothetical protein
MRAYAPRHPHATPARSLARTVSRAVGALVAAFCAALLCIGLVGYGIARAGAAGCPSPPSDRCCRSHGAGRAVGQMRPLKSRRRSRPFPRFPTRIRPRPVWPPDFFSHAIEARAPPLRLNQRQAPVSPALHQETPTMNRSIFSLAALALLGLSLHALAADKPAAADAKMPARTLARAAACAQPLPLPLRPCPRPSPSPSRRRPRRLLRPHRLPHRSSPGWCRPSS